MSPAGTSVSTDMAEQFAHETLAEAHYFVVALSFGIEIGAAFSAPHRECRKTVFEDLLEREKFQNPERNGGMEPEPAFVGSDRAVHLDAISAINADRPVIIHPRNPKHHYSLRLDHPLENLGVAILRMPLQRGP